MAYRYLKHYGVHNWGTVSALSRQLSSQNKYVKIITCFHKRVKSHTCSTCRKSFIQYGSYSNVHERIHTGVKSDTCPTCVKSLTKSRTCSTHERVHTGVKLHTCATCGQSYTQSGHVRVHDRIHTGVKPYIYVLYVEYHLHNSVASTYMKSST